MRKAIGIGSFGAIAIAAMFLLSGIPMAGAAFAPSTTVDLIAGQNTDVGYVKVSHNIDTFFVEIQLDVSGWTIIDTHVALSVDDGTDADPHGEDDCDLRGIPQTKKHSPIPGHFAFQDPDVQTSTYVKYIIPFSLTGIDGIQPDFEFGDEICIAVHAVVQYGTGEYAQQQTAWGDGEHFDKGWSMYFCYTPQPYKTLPTVPSGLWQFKPTYVYPNVGATSYWSVQFTVSNPFPLVHPSSTYESWCVDNNNRDYLSSGGTYNAYLYSSCDPSSFPTTPGGVFVGLERFSVPWDKINYILNHQSGRTPRDIQEAIWFFTNNINPTTAGGLALKADANANGAGYIIPAGGIFAVILYTPGYYAYPNNYYQMIIIEVDP